MTNTEAAARTLLTVVLSALALIGAVFGTVAADPFTPSVSGVYAVPGGALTVFSDTTARFDPTPGAQLLLALDAPPEDTTASLWECLLDLGYVGFSGDGAERLYVSPGDHEVCS